MKKSLIAAIMLLAFCSCNSAKQEQTSNEDRLSNLAVVDNDAEGTQEGIKFLEDFYAGPFLSGEGDFKDYVSSSLLSKITKSYYDPMDDRDYEGYDLSAFGGMHSIEPRGSVKGISRCKDDWYDVAYVDEWSGTNEIEIVKIKIAKSNGKYQIVSTDRVDEVSSSSNNSSNYNSGSGSSSSQQQSASSSSSSYRPFTNVASVRAFLMFKRFKSDDGYVITFEDQGNQIYMNGRCMSSTVSITNVEPESAILHFSGPFGTSSFVALNMPYSKYVMDINDRTQYYAE